MKRLVIAMLILSGGIVGLGTLHQTNRQIREMVALRQDECRASGKRLTAQIQAITSLRDEVEQKTSSTARALPTANRSSELLGSWDGDLTKAPSKELAGLRERLGACWNDSGEYVLVSKAALKRFSFNRLYSVDRASDTACAVLAFSPEDQDGIITALKNARQASVSRVRREEPVGDIVAQYTIQANPVLEQSISNQFSAEITSLLGQERSELFLPQAWRQLKANLAPKGPEPVIFTIKRSVEDGQPKLVYELKEGTSLLSGDVRYAEYPSSWFLTLFPGGWKPIAEREGFELPKDFGGRARP